MESTLTSELRDRSRANEELLRTYQVVLDPGEEFIEKLGAFAVDESLQLASFTAIGGFEHFSLGFYDLETGEFDTIPFKDDQVEVLSLMGEITRNQDGSSMVHGHVVVGRRDGTTRGGHLLRGVVRPVLIVTVQEMSHHHGIDIDHHLHPGAKGSS